MTTDTSCGQILSFMFENIPVRGAIVRLENLHDHIPSLAQEGYGVSKYLSEMLAASATLMTDLKHKADITLQVHSKSSIPLMVSQCSAEGHLKAYANIDADASTDITFNDIVKDDAVFAVSVQQDEHNYQSLVGLNSDSIGSSIEQYFNDSVQLPTYFKVFTDKKDGQASCGAIFLQVMPNSDELEDDWNRLGMIIKTIKPEEILPGELTGTDLLYRLFSEDKVVVYPAKALTFPIEDVRSKMKIALKKVGVDTCKEMLEEAPIEMVCEFSGKVETFVEDDLKELFGSQWG